jgi:hypothetical protein
MVELARQQDGFLGVESARNEIGITVFGIFLIWIYTCHWLGLS